MKHTWISIGALATCAWLSALSLADWDDDDLPPPPGAAVGDGQEGAPPAPPGAFRGGRPERGPPPPPDGRGRPGMGAGHPPPPGDSGLPEDWRALLRVLGDRRPDLAERVERMMLENPGAFAELFANSIVAELDGAGPQGPPLLRGLAGRGGHRPPLGGPGRPPFPPPGERPPPGRPGFGPPDGEMLRLRERDRDLERACRETADQLRGAGEGADHAQRERAREQLRQQVTEQFDLRTQMRAAELKRVEADLRRIQEALQRLSAEMERRARERDTIIARRVESLLSAEPAPKPPSDGDR